MSSTLNGTNLTINSLTLPQILNASRVGGKIFYINTASTNTYSFYNSDFTSKTAPSSASSSTDYASWYYTKTIGNNIDKYYVYYPVRITGRCYGYYNMEVGGIGESAQQSLGIGGGKAASNKVLYVNDSSTYYSSSIWSYIKDIRAQKLNGCSDWYIGNQYEYNELKTLLGVSTFSYNTCCCEEMDTVNVQCYTSNKGWYPGLTKGNTNSSGWWLIRSF